MTVRATLAYQQRATQKRVNISRFAPGVADAGQGAPARGNSDAGNEARNARKSAWGAEEVQLVGRSRVIHML